MLAGVLLLVDGLLLEENEALLPHFGKLAGSKGGFTIEHEGKVIWPVSLGMCCCPPAMRSPMSKELKVMP